MNPSQIPGGVLSSLPSKGLCAHRASFQTAPENTLHAIKEAVRLGAQMIEFDLRLTRDGVLVLMHDETVDRTTSGKGPVADLTLDELRQLDAGSWKGAEFAHTPIPTFEDVLPLIPENRWINCELKGGADLGAAAARALLKAGREKQTFFAAKPDAAEAARKVSPSLMICNMDRADSVENYVEKTLAMRASFIQFTRQRPPSRELIGRLHDHGIKVNYYYALAPDELPGLFAQGVDFVLVNHLAGFQAAAASLGMPPL